ncbi:hypothetical protein [Acinetobacter courvalinii]|uniref:hypothetical protein n=1 Tax=Acinetobacter courvalinii TaxID=280147 RepID=UPI00190006E1|nr:hypothetical protein [Acinetobacter courvalinii]MBJ8417304.1 hypothetical protein [Acinetobacter courvalinii]
MSFAALCWALVAFIQACMLSQYGQKQLQYVWLNASRRKLLVFSAIIFLACSLGLNCWSEGSSVGPLSWVFVILPAAFFLQVLGFYLFRKHFVQIWCCAMLAALVFTFTGN